MAQDIEQQGSTIIGNTWPNGSPIDLTQPLPPYIVAQIYQQYLDTTSYLTTNINEGMNYNMFTLQDFVGRTYSFDSDANCEVLYVTVDAAAPICLTVEDNVYPAPPTRIRQTVCKGTPGDGLSFYLLDCAIPLVAQGITYEYSWTAAVTKTQELVSTQYTLLVQCVSTAYWQQVAEYRAAQYTPPAEPSSSSNRIAAPLPVFTFLLVLVLFVFYQYCTL